MSKALVISTLLAESAVTDLCGTRIFSRVIPEGETVPAITSQRVVRVPVNQLSGPATLDGDRYQVSSWALTDDEADELSKQARIALEAVGFLLVLELDASYESDTRRYGIRQDFSIHTAR